MKPPANPPTTPAERPMWIDGWYQYCLRMPSPNFGPRPTGTAIDLVVLHSISLPPGQYGGNEVIQLFTNQLDWEAHPYFKRIEGITVSAHFFIRRGGELLQFVSANDRAWHAGQSEHQSRCNCNDFSIGIELEGLEGAPFELPQYETLSGLCAAILQLYPISHIVGHEHIAPGRKNDPGAGFDWLRLQQSTGLNPVFFPPEVSTKK